MSSTRTLTVALVVVVLLAGCSAIPGLDDDSDGDTSPGPPAPDYHGFAVTTDTGGTAVDVSVTVTKDGKEVVAREFSSDGNGRFLRLGTVNESGPYTVTVNTTLPESGGGNMSEQTTVNGTLGNETIVDVTYTDVEFPSIRLPRQELSEPLKFRKSNPGKPAGQYRVLVEYQGETIVSKTFRESSRGPVDLAPLSKTGLYRVSVRSQGDRWTNETVVVHDPDSRLFTEMEVFPNVRVYGPDEPLPPL